MFVMLLCFSVPAFAATDTTDKSALTVDEYISFLQKESPEDLAKFTALSPDQQQEFIDLLLDPATYNTTNNENKNVSRSTKYTTNLPNSSPMLSSSTDWDAWGTQTVSIFGISILEYRIEVGYRVSNGTVTQILYNDAYVVRNLNPMVQTDTISSSAYISGNKAIARGVFYYKLGPINDMSVQIGNIYGELIGYPNGDTSISYWRD
ncbi:hypothetical protein [Thermoanaerobacterium sp. RBIITD]|uniref:hypothetical protein n=1 Tax=Thermoanaerobacterium sp. RBIITD TaxID=1550240 RepID=UPI00155FF62D|nr:hypothetical protein [Thermoanaerobacterium sp. RBIITD]